MWNFLIVLIIAIILFMMNPLGRVHIDSPTQIDSKTQNEVNQTVNQAEQQINQAKTLQNQEKSELNRQ